MPGYHIVRPATHEDWLETRKGGIGSSDAGTIMGVSHFSTPLTLWKIRKGLLPPVEETQAMRNGHYLEPAVAEFFSAATGATINYDSEGDWLAVDNDREYLRVSPDRLFWPKGVEHTVENWHILEIKSTSQMVDKDDLPDYWYCQIQYQMGIMGIKRGALAWITSSPKLEMDYAWVDFNQGFFDYLISRIDQFWTVNILQDIEPEAVKAEDAALKYPFSKDKSSVEIDDEVLQVCRDYHDLKKQIDTLSKELAEKESIIKLTFRENEAMVYTDEEGKAVTVATYKSTNCKSFDEEAFRKDNPDLYKEYLKTSLDSKTLLKEKAAETADYVNTVKGSRRLVVKGVEQLS